MSFRVRVGRVVLVPYGEYVGAPEPDDSSVYVHIAGSQVVDVTGGRIVVRDAERQYRDNATELSGMPDGPIDTVVDFSDLWAEDDYV